MTTAAEGEPGGVGARMRCARGASTFPSRRRRRPGSLNRGRRPPRGHGAPVAPRTPERAAAAPAAPAAGRPGPRRARRERRPRAEPPVRGLSRVRVHAARPAGPAEDGLQPGHADGDPPAAGRAPGPLCLLAHRALRTLSSTAPRQ